MPVDIQLQIILRLIIAGVLGGMLGLERESVHKPAGLRTYILVTIAATLLTAGSFSLMQTEVMTDFSGIDPLRMMASLLTGIGFIGAGVIIHRSDHHVEGITTAAGLWLTTVIGITVGMGGYLIAAVTTLFALFTFLVLGKLGNVK